MPLHAPPGYFCPFCQIIAGHSNEPPHTQVADVVLRTEHATAFVNARWWPNNAGHVLVVPNAHVENLYEVSRELAAHVHEAVRRVALALKGAYKCDGVSTRRHSSSVLTEAVLCKLSDEIERPTSEERALFDAPVESGQ